MPEHTLSLPRTLSCGVLGPVLPRNGLCATIIVLRYELKSRYYQGAKDKWPCKSTQLYEH